MNCVGIFSISQQQKKKRKLFHHILCIKALSITYNKSLTIPQQKRCEIMSKNFSVLQVSCTRLVLGGLIYIILLEAQLLNELIYYQAIKVYFHLHGIHDVRRLVILNYYRICDLRLDLSELFENVAKAWVRFQECFRVENFVFNLINSSLPEKHSRAMLKI